MGDKHGWNFTWKMILSFIWMFPKRPFNTGENHLIDVKVTLIVIKGWKICDLGKWLLNTGWSCNAVSLDTGLTVFTHFSGKIQQSNNVHKQFSFTYWMPTHFISWEKREDKIEFLLVLYNTIIITVDHFSYALTTIHDSKPDFHGQKYHHFQSCGQRRDRMSSVPVIR